MEARVEAEGKTNASGCFWNLVARLGMEVERASAACAVTVVVVATLVEAAAQLDDEDRPASHRRASS